MLAETTKTHYDYTKTYSKHSKIMHTDSLHLNTSTKCIILVSPACSSRFSSLRIEKGACMGVTWIGITTVAGITSADRRVPVQLIGVAMPSR
jgi:hypothetical protein